MALMPTDANSKAIQVLQPGVTQTVTVGAASVATSTAFTSKVVRVVSTTDCHVAVNNTATSTSCYLPAGVVEYYRVVPGETLNFIQNAAGGTVYVTDMF